MLIFIDRACLENELVLLKGGAVLFFFCLFHPIKDLVVPWVNWYAGSKVKGPGTQ